MSLVAVTCEGCGGAVAMQAGREAPSCLFCGQARLRPVELPEGVETPAAYLPFRVTAAQAQQSFERFATSSIWHPRDLRRSHLRIRPAFVAAWDWEADVETHWAAMVPGPTRSGVQPVSGAATHREAVLVPASALLTRQELVSLGSFRVGDAVPFDSADPPGEHEIGTLTRSAATSEARKALTDEFTSRLAKELRARKVSAAHLVLRATGRPMLVPVWIGAYRWKGRLYRVLIHGQDGRLVGKGPVSAWRVLAAIALASGLLALVTVLVTALGS